MAASASPPTTAKPMVAAGVFPHTQRGYRRAAGGVENKQVRGCDPLGGDRRRYTPVEFLRHRGAGRKQCDRGGVPPVSAVECIGDCPHDRHSQEPAIKVYLRHKKTIRETHGRDIRHIAANRPRAGANTRMTGVNMETTKRIYAPHELICAEPIHPGEILKDELQARGISQRKFAGIIGMPYTAFNEIINGKRSITTDTALKIEAATGITANLWIGLQSDYNMQTARRNTRLSAVLEQIRKAVAVL